MTTTFSCEPIENGRIVTYAQLTKLMEVLRDNGIESSEASTVAEAVGYVLDLDMEMALDEIWKEESQ